MAREKPRRQYGTGSVFAHHKPGCPHADYVDPKTGKRTVAKCADRYGCRMRASYEAGYTKTGGRRRPVVTGKTEAEVKRKLRDAVKAAEAGAEASSRTTVKAWSDTWLALIEKTLRPSSLNADRVAVRQWIVPTIGHRRLAELTPADVRAVSSAVLAHRHEKGPRKGQALSTSTARRYQATLVTMLAAAREEGHDVPDRVLRVAPPAVALNDRQAFPTLDAVKMLAAAARLPHGSRWAVAFLQGPRPGECRGLTWDSIGEDAFVISWQLQRLPYRVKRDPSSGFRVPDAFECRQVAGALHLVRPKTRAGQRAYPLLDLVGDALEHWRQIALAPGQPAPPGNLVWPMAADDKADRAEFQALQDAAEVRHPSGRYYHLHEIRHTTASLLLELGVPERIRVQIMGHSSIASTAAYEHARDPQMREALLGVAGQLQLTGSTAEA